MPRMCLGYAQDMPQIYLESSIIYNSIFNNLSITRKRLDQLDIPNPPALQLINRWNEQLLIYKAYPDASIIGWNGRNLDIWSPQPATFGFQSIGPLGRCFL